MTSLCEEQRGTLMFVSKRFRTIAVLTAFVALGGLAPSMAMAGTSWFENNYSYDYGGGYGVGVCDQEADGSPAYARYETNGSSYRLDDSNGSQPGCSAQDVNFGVYRHHVCEGQVWNDPCGEWFYP